MWVGRSNNNFIAFISLCSRSAFSPLFKFQDSALVRRADRLIESCISRRREVSSLLSVSLDAMVLMEVVDDLSLIFLDSMFLAFFPSLLMTSPRYLYDFVSLIAISPTFHACGLVST